MTEVAVKLLGKLPTGDGNGLANAGPELVADPAQLRMALVIFKVKEAAQDYDAEMTIAKVRVLRIEILRDPEFRGVLERALMREYERRTGQTMLPLELEDEVRQAFESMAENEDKPPDPPPLPGVDGGGDGDDGSGGPS